MDEKVEAFEINKEDGSVTAEIQEMSAEESEKENADEVAADGAEESAEADASEVTSEAVTDGQKAPTESSGEKEKRKRSSSGKKKKEAEETEEQEIVERPEHPEAAIEAVLFATGNSVKIDRLAEILGMTCKEIRDAATILKAQYEREERGITITELDDALQLGTKGEYYSYLMKLTKSAKQYSLTDTVIETLSIIAYKQPVTRAQIEQIRGVSCDHALNKLLEYDLIEEVGRLDAPGKPLLFGTTEQFLRSFGVKSIGDLPTLSPELQEDFKLQAEAEAAENLKVDI